MNADLERELRLRIEQFVYEVAGILQAAAAEALASALNIEGASAEQHAEPRRRTRRGRALAFEQDPRPARLTELTATIEVVAAGLVPGVLVGIDDPDVVRAALASLEEDSVGSDAATN